MNMEEWNMIGCPEPRGEGQRFFRRQDNDVDLYICDNSGGTPDLADDGPLRFLPGMNIKIEARERGGGISIYVPVTVERKSGRVNFFNHYAVSRCWVSAKELLWMIDAGYADAEKIELDKSLRPIVSLYMRLGTSCLKDPTW